MCSGITRALALLIAGLTLGHTLFHPCFAAAQVAVPLCCAQPPSRMVAWWTFDEPAGPVAADVAGTPQNGTHIAGPVVVAGKVQRALEFNGTSYVQAASAPELQFGRGDFSMDAWVWLIDGSDTRVVLDKRTFTGVPGSSMKWQVRGYAVFIDNGRLGLQLADGGFTNYLSSASLPVARWVHIAITVDRDDQLGVRFYYDGALVGTGNPVPHSGTLDSPAPLLIGGPSSPTESGVRARLDEVELFDRVLWPSEIVTLVRADSVGKCRAPCGPLEMNVSSAPEQWTVVSVPPSATMPSSGHPTVVTPYSTWQTSNTGPWVSANPGTYGTGPAGWYEYEYRFCLCPGFSSPKLVLTFRVDDSYQLVLNGTALPPNTPPAGFAQPSPATVVLTSGFQPGTNVLRLRVSNAFVGANPTGFALSGVLTATAGRCPAATP